MFPPEVQVVEPSVKLPAAVEINTTDVVHTSSLRSLPPLTASSSFRASMSEVIVVSKVFRQRTIRCLTVIAMLGFCWRTKRAVCAVHADMRATRYAGSQCPNGSQVVVPPMVQLEEPSVREPALVVILTAVPTHDLPF